MIHVSVKIAVREKQTPYTLMIPREILPNHEPWFLVRVTFAKDDIVSPANIQLMHETNTIINPSIDWGKDDFYASKNKVEWFKCSTDYADNPGDIFKDEYFGPFRIGPLDEIIKSVCNRAVWQYTILLERGRGQ